MYIYATHTHYIHTYMHACIHTCMHAYLPRWHWQRIRRAGSTPTQAPSLRNPLAQPADMHVDTITHMHIQVYIEDPNLRLLMCTCTYTDANVNTLTHESSHSPPTNLPPHASTCFTVGKTKTKNLHSTQDRTPNRHATLGLSRASYFHNVSALNHRRRGPHGRGRRRRRNILARIVVRRRRCAA